MTEFNDDNDNDNDDWYGESFSRINHEKEFKRDYDLYAHKAWQSKHRGHSNIKEILATVHMLEKHFLMRRRLDGRFNADFDLEYEFFIFRELESIFKNRSELEIKRQEFSLIPLVLRKYLHEVHPSKAQEIKSKVGWENQLVDDCYYLYCKQKHLKFVSKTGKSYFSKFLSNGSEWFYMPWRKIFINNQEIFLDFFCRAKETNIVTHDPVIEYIFKDLSAQLNKYQLGEVTVFDLPYSEN